MVNTRAQELKMNDERIGAIENELRDVNRRLTSLDCLDQLEESILALNTRLDQINLKQPCHGPLNGGRRLGYGYGNEHPPPPRRPQLSDFTYLRQTGSLADFNSDWDVVTARLNLSEDYMVDAYLSALKMEIQGPVRMFNPRTLQEARRLARMQEVVLEKSRNSASTSNSRWVSTSSFNSSVPSVSHQKAQKNHRNALRSLVPQSKVVAAPFEAKSDDAVRITPDAAKMTTNSTMGSGEIEVSTHEIIFERQRKRHMNENFSKSFALPSSHSSMPSSTLSSTLTPEEDFQMMSQSAQPLLTSSSAVNSHKGAFMAAKPSSDEEYFLGASKNSSFGTNKQGEWTKLSTPEEEAGHQVLSVFSPPMVAVAPPLSLSPASSPTQDDHSSSKEVPLKSGSPNLSSSRKLSQVESVSETDEEGMVWQVKECVERCTWLNSESEKSNSQLGTRFSQGHKYFEYALCLLMSHGRIDFLLQENAPTRHMLQVWFKGKLVEMLVGSNMIQCVLYFTEYNIQWTKEWFLCEGTRVYFANLTWSKGCLINVLIQWIKGWFINQVCTAHGLQLATTSSKCHKHFEGALGLSNQDTGFISQGPNSLLHWANSIKFVYMFVNLAFHVNFSPTRILLQIWFKGELIFMLIGRFYSPSEKDKENGAFFCGTKVL